MPGWEFDRRTGTMIPKKATGLEFYNVNGGLKVIDNDLGTSFIILRSNDSIGYAQGIAGTRGVKLYDYNKAQRIAERVKRCLPTSQYTDYRKFCRGVRENQMSDEDKALLETLVNGYKGNSLNEALNELDYSTGVLNPKNSDFQTRGATDYHGVSGLIKSLPSMIISFIICPPLAMIKLLGAVRIRTEKRWLKTMFNTNTWEDFIAMPNEKKEELKKKMKDKLAEKTQYYYSELANGEIIKVPACSKLEARDMILAIEREDIEKRYAKYNNAYSSIDGNEVEPHIYDATSETPSFYSNLCQGDEKNKVKMWVVKFNDGQACYAFGLDGQRDQIMKEAEESKKAIIDYYKNVVLKSRDGDDNDKNKKMKHLGIGKGKDGEMSGDYDEIDELFTPPKVDDMIEIKNISMYSPITTANEKDFGEPTTSVLSWNPKQYPQYILNFGETEDSKNPAMMQIKVPASKDDELSEIILKSIINGLSDFIQQESNTITTVTNNQNINWVIERYEVNNSTFNIVCIDNRQKDASGNVTSGIDRNVNYPNCIMYSEINNILRTVEESFRNAFSDANLERGVRNEYNTNYINGKVLKEEIKKEDTTINWNECWKKLLEEIKPNYTVKGEVVKQSGGDKIRQDVSIKIAA